MKPWKTYVNVMYVFPHEVFGGISDEGKDFIQKLLLKNRK